MQHQLILIKMGGSVITDKSRPLAASRDSIAAISRAVARIEEPVIIVHGGGSFGHYWSVKYGMHSAADEYDTTGVAAVKNSMVQLDMIVLEEMFKAKARPHVIAPSGFMSGTRPIGSRIESVGEIAENTDMTPVTYGDALYVQKGGGVGPQTYILSGDRIMSHMARVLRPRLCIFALGEDGLYADMESKRLIDTVSARAVQGMAAGGVNTAAKVDGSIMDVTGGMTRKIAESARITMCGVPVAFVNGNHPKRIRDAVAAAEHAGRFKGTFFEAHDAGKREK